MKTAYAIAFYCALFVDVSGRGQTTVPKDVQPLESKTANSSNRMNGYVGQDVPFARAASGIKIYGDAWTWWSQAAGKYERGSEPRVGAVIAFARSDKLRHGHVAVVSRIVERRVLTLTHANWSRIDGVRGDLEQDVTLFDVSPSGDWSQVKVWFRGSTGLGGSVYPVHGFIYGPNAAVKPQVDGQTPDYVQPLIDAYER